MTDAPTLTRWGAWKLAARPKTLPAAIAPVLIGTALAIHDGAFAPFPALAALAGSLLLQVGVNIANDYFDATAGVDSSARKGPVRVTQSGLLPPGEVRTGMILVFTTVALIGVYLIIVGGWPLAAIGIAAILSALAYSGGPFPLASHGLGDLFVFLFFGLAAVFGTYYAQARAFSWDALVVAVPPGLLITAILVVNNLRDIDTDRAAGKHTMAVLLGVRGSRTEYVALLVAAYLIPLGGWLAGRFGVLALLPLVSVPMSLPLIGALQTHHEDGPVMNRALAATARLALVYCVLFAVGLAL